MGKKVRIHDLAKNYGMSGKDMASKLRDFGFSQAKSHMSALDEFELMQAEALLEVNGYPPASAPTTVESDESGGGLIVRKKKKKARSVEGEGERHVAAEPAPEDHDSGARPSRPPIMEAPDEAPGAPAEAVAEADTAPAPQPVAETREGPVGSGATESTLESPADQASAAVSEPAPAATSEEAPSTLAPEDSTETRAEEVEDEETSEEVAETPSEPAESATQDADEPADEKSEEKEADAKEAKGPKRKGNVVGFIDPTSFQRAQPAKRKPESRRLQSRDDSMPDVRPTFGREKGKGASSRGKLTAAQLREREQGRFLRRARPGGGGAGGGRRTGRGGYGGRDQVTESPLAGSTVAIEAPITTGKLAESLKLKSAVVQGMALRKGYGMFTLNSLLDDDTAALLASEFEVELDIRHEITAEEAHLDEVKKKRSAVEEEELVDRAPTVAFLGHVDHGKTTLIDKIRTSRVAEGESGGITQHIGAYQVETKLGHKVTIVDTPGHGAFTAMRARGARAVDVVVLVVAGDDGVKPHTEEAVNHARAAEAPIVVAVNKKDKPGYNFNATVQQLMGLDLTPEMYGGKTAMFQVSGLTGEGIDDLLEHIVLMTELELGLKAHPKGPASGVVLEAEILQGKGIVAHLLIQDGTLSRGDVILAGEGYGKVRSILDDRGNQIEEAGPSMPVEVTGLAALPGVSDSFHVIEHLAKAKEIAVERERTNRAVALAAKREPSKDLAAILGSEPKKISETINLIVRCDVQGSVEVIRSEVDKLTHEEVGVKLVHSGVGPITESDVDLAATSNALLVAFHVGVNGKARTEADRHGLEIRRYEVIYELLDDLRKMMEGALAPEFREEITGHVEIRRLFKSSRIGTIAGCYVLDGKIARNALVRLLRDDKVVYTGSIASLRREKDEVKDVRESFECGIVLKDYRDIQEGDVIEAYRMKEVKRTLG